MLKTIIRKLFATNGYFTIAIRSREPGLLGNLRFSAAYTVPATCEDWCADPFLVDDGERTYLFFEKIRGMLGRIEVAEVQPDCSLSESTQILGGDSHFSYPFVFRRDGGWYMIPESASLGEVALYAAEDFPTKWKKEAVLLNKGAVDTTVFQWNGGWYLLTFFPSADGEQVTPKAFRMNGTELEPLTWEQYNPLRVRGAGRPFLCDGALFRPVQVSKKHIYGNRVAFARVEIEGNTYRELPVCSLKPERVSGAHVFFDGLHTYNSSERFEAIDLRCGDLKISKPLQMGRWYFKKFFSG